MKIRKDIVYNPETGLVMDLYLPEGEVKASFLFFHGGGLTGGNHETPPMTFAPYLTENGIAVLSAKYRLLTEKEYPACVEDAAAAAAFAKREGKALTGCERLFVGGSSAGGYLSMMLCFDAHFLAVHGVSPLEIDGYIHDAGQPTCHFNELKFRGIDARRVIVDERAPLFHVGTAKEYAPMLFLTAEHDMENRLEQNMLMVSTLRHFGYDEKKYALHVLPGTHCQYGEENGESVFGKEVRAFIFKVLGE